MSVPVADLVGRVEKILLVCSKSCGEVEKRLAGAGLFVSKVSDGNRAVSTVRRELFDVAFLVSTGRKMDLTETLFNLRDIRSSLPIVIVTDRCDAGASVMREIAATVPNTIVVDLQGLEVLIEESAGRSARKFETAKPDASDKRSMRH